MRGTRVRHHVCADVAGTGPVVLQGVQTVFAPSQRLGTWPDADHLSRLVCIVQGVDAAILRQSLTILHAEPGTHRPASIADLMNAHH